MCVLVLGRLCLLDRSRERRQRRLLVPYVAPAAFFYLLYNLALFPSPNPQKPRMRAVLY